MRRGVKVALATLVVAAAAVTVALIVTRRSTTTASSTNKTVHLSTVAVVQQDLVTYNQTTATLGFTSSATISSPVAGTVTSIVKAGDTIQAGSVVGTVDGTPVVALVGDAPSYRDLSTSSTAGDDVRQLETNLVLLGFDPTGAVHIDETFDSATATAVKAWEASLGLTEDGKVPKSRVAYIPGKLLVDTVTATVGGAAGVGSPLLSGRLAEREFLVPATIGHSGVVDRYLAPTTPAVTGSVLFWDAGNPVVAIEGAAAATPALLRDLTVGSVGADVKVLEQMLQLGGFDKASPMTVDDHFDEATAAAVSVWRTSLGIAVDPAAKVVVPAGSYEVVPSGLFAGAPLVPAGTQLTHDTVVLPLTTAARAVTTNAPVGDSTFTLGATIDVVYPDQTVAQGTIVAVGTVASATSNTPGATPSVPITIHVASIPDSVASFVSIPVTLRVVADSAPKALVVPVSALVALAEGGFAVEVVTGTAANGTDTTQLEAVKPGLYANGFVAVTGDQLKVGQKVVVPS